MDLYLEGLKGVSFSIHRETAFAGVWFDAICFSFVVMLLVVWDEARR